MIIKTFVCGPFATNTYLLACSETKKAAVIDAAPECTRLINEAKNELHLQLEMLLLTHSHWDHIADAHALKKKFHIPVFVHSADVGNLKQPGSDRLKLPFSAEGVEADGELQDGQEIDLGTLKIKVIHTPGHSPGGVCFYLEKEGVLFSGDTLFQGTIGNLSFPTARPTLMWQSLKKLAQLPPHTKVYPGHGNPTTIGEESWLADAEEHFRRYL